MRAVYAVILAVVCLQPSPAETPQQLNDRGVDFFRQGRYADSAQAYREALARYKEAPLRNVNGYAATLNNLAAALQTDGKVAEAQPLLEEVVSLEDRIRGEDHIVTHALNNLALVHHAAGEYTKAITLLQRALNRDPEASISRAGTLHNLGAAYLQIGQYKKAGQLFEQSLQTNTQVGAVRETPATLAFLAVLAKRANDETRAFTLLDRALTLRREIHGPNHPHVALSLNDIAELFRDTERYDESAAMFEESLRMMQASVGKDHPQAALVMYQFGELRRLQGRHQEALQLFERAMHILESTFGPKHAQLAVIYKSAALSAKKLRRKDEAKIYAGRAEAVEQGQVPYRRNTVDVSSFTTPR